MAGRQIEDGASIGFETFPPDLGTTRVDLFVVSEGKIIQRCHQRSGCFYERELTISDPMKLADRLQAMANKLRGK